MLGRWTAIGGVALACLVAACGDTVTVPRGAVSTGAPLTTGPVDISVTPSGTPFSVASPDRVRLVLDDAGLLVMRLSVTSRAPDTETVSIRASLYDSRGALIGDAQGSTPSLAPGATADLELSGPRPNGTVARAVIELTGTPAP